MVNWLVSTVGLLSSLLLLRHLRGLKSRQLDALLMAFHLNFFGVSFRAHLRRGRLTEFTIFLAINNVINAGALFFTTYLFVYHIMLGCKGMSTFDYLKHKER